MPLSSPQHLAWVEALAARAPRLSPLLLPSLLLPPGSPMAVRAGAEPLAPGLPVATLEAMARQQLQAEGCPSGPGPLEDGPPAEAPARRLAVAAALMACLEEATEPPSDLQRRLLQELTPEWERLKGEVGLLEQTVAGLQASRFAPTTRLRALSRWYLGGLSYSGNQIGPGNTYRPGGEEQPLPLPDAISFVYDLQLNLDTSFHGQDLLRARLRAGDGAYSGFRGNPVTPMVRLDGVSPFCSLRNQQQGNCRNNQVRLDKLFYRTPLGSGFTLTLGPRLSQKDMLGLWPSLYGTSERILSAFDYAGAVGAYSDVKGAGLGVHWRQPKSKRESWVISAVYAAGNPNRANPGDGGVLTGASEGAATLQVGYVGRTWSVAGVYTHNQAGARQDEIITPLAGETWPALKPGLSGSVNAFGLSGTWDPTPIADWLPAISLGWGWNQNVYNVSGPNAASPQLAAESQSWMAALEWKDVLDDGNNLGLAVGQPKFLTRFVTNSGQSGAFDSSWLMEAWYRIRVSNALALTPAIFWLPRPRGQLTRAGTSWDDPVLPTGRGATLGVLGAVLKATFRF